MCIVSHYTERWATNWSAAPASSVRLTPGDKSWSATKKPGALLDMGTYGVLIESLIKLRREFCSSLFTLVGNWSYLMDQSRVNGGDNVCAALQVYSESQARLSSNWSAKIDPHIWD